MLWFAEMLWQREDFIGHSYPNEVCESLLKSIRILNRMDLGGMVRDMTASEFSVLCCAADYPKNHRGEFTTVAEIAARMGISVPAVSRTLKSLEGKGYIERKIDNYDRRSIRVAATDSGEECFEHNFSLITGKLNKLMAVFSPEEIHQIAALYKKLAGAAAKMSENQKGDFHA